MADPQSLFHYDLKNLQKMPKLIRQIEKSGGKIEKPLKRWGVYMLGQTGFLFQRGQRGPIKWKPLAEVTKIMRAFRSRGSGRTGPKRILQDTGALKRSIKTVTFTHKGTRAQIVFTRDPKAKTHQEGGTMKIPRRVIVPKKKKALAFMTGVSARSGGGHLVIVRKVVQPARTEKVPKRPVVFILAKDKRKAVELMEDHARSVTRNFGRTK